MKGSRSLLLIVFLSFFFLNIGSVYANCSDKIIDYSYSRSYSSQLLKYAITSYTAVTEYNSGLGEGESVCSVSDPMYEGGTLTGQDTYYAATVKTCKSDGEYGVKQCDTFNQICVSSTDSDGKKTAECKDLDSSGCDISSTEIGKTFYTLGNDPKEFSEHVENVEEGESLCFGDVIKVCTARDDGTFGWEETDTVCSSGQYCKMQDRTVWGGSIFLKSTCASICNNPDGLAEDIYCDEENNKLYLCYASDSEWHQVEMSTLANNCLTCSNSIDSTGEVVPECDDTNNYCDKISTSDGVESVNKGTDDGDSYNDGATICNTGGTTLYVCNKDSSNYTDGYYSWLANCSDETYIDDNGEEKNKVCGAGSDGKAACITQEEAAENDQSIVTSQVTLTISTDTGFMCDVDGNVNSDEKGGSNDDNDGVRTAFGCVPITASGLANKLLPILFGIAGGISFLRMVYGFILMATSSGDEKKFIEAKSVISSAIIGLLVSIFAIFLFRLIFVNILQIPGLE